MPNSASWLRSVLISMVRCLTSISRARWGVSAACCPALFTGTKCIDGRLAASQIAAASTASFLPRLT